MKWASSSYAYNIFKILLIVGGQINFIKVGNCSYIKFR